MDIYALKVGLRYGPYTEHELHEQLVCGFFQQTNFASSDGGHTWRTIAEVDRLPQPQPAQRRAQPTQLAPAA